MAEVQQQQPVIATERNREVARLYRVHSTVCEMLADRGYELRANNNQQQQNADAAGGVGGHQQDDGNWLIARDLKSFTQKVLDPAGGPLLRQQLNFVCSRTAETGERRSILVWYEPNDIKSDVIKTVIQNAESYEVHSVLIVCAAKIQPIARTYVETSNREGIAAQIELFPEDHLVVNITRHELVPKHEPLTLEETKKVLEAFALNVSMLPRLLATDPVALYFGLKRGQVVKITRKSETAGQYVTFRQVV